MIVHRIPCGNILSNAQPIDKRADADHSPSVRSRKSSREQVLREWNAVPSDTESFEPHFTPSLATAVPRALKKLGLDERWHHNQIAMAWTEVVGATLSRHTQPIAFRRHCLIIGVDNSVWLNELSRHLKPELLRKLRERFGSDAPHDILFRIIISTTSI